MEYDLFGDPVAAADLSLTSPLAYGNPDPLPAPAPTLWDYDATPTAQSAEIGTNVTLFAANRTSDPVIFTNQLKGAWPWLPSGQADTVSYGENGYITDLGEANKAVSTILKRSASLDGIEPFTGTFRLYGQGVGSFSIGTGLEQNILRQVDTADLATEVIDGEIYWYVDFDYSSAPADGKGTVSAKMFLFETETGDHIRDMALVHHSHLDIHRAGETFAPEFVADLEPYTTLRFMDWMNTNILYLDKDGRAVDPELRHISTDHFTFNTRASGKLEQENIFAGSVPIEYIVELANTVEADAWINLPADITDARALEMATYVRDHLDPDLDVYWEYGNEIWNNAKGFSSYTYAARMGADTFDTIGGVNLNGAVAWSAYRGPQLYDLIETVFDQDADGDAAGLRFVAPMWAYSGPVRGNGQIDEASYTATYFAATEAQAMPDAPSRPADIVTDYAVGLYFSAVGSVGSQLTDYLLETYDSAEAQAEATARLQLFGLDADRSYELDHRALDNPIENVSYREGINIGVTRLIWADHEDGLDLLRDLDEVLRLEGTALQYRGVHASDWTTVLIFDEVPAKSLEQMILDIELLGFGFKRDGRIEIGPRFSLDNNETMRLDGHLAFVESLGLNFVSYEGGPHIDMRADDSVAILNAYFEQGYSDIVFNAWFAEMTEADVDLFMDYMSHDRYARDTDFWGVQEYVGQAIGEGQSAQFLLETIAAGHKADAAPVIEVPIINVQAAPAPAPQPADTWPEDAAALADFSSEVWRADTPVSHPDDGVIALEGKGMLKTAIGIPVTPGGEHTVSFKVLENDGGKIRVVVTARGAGATRVGFLEIAASEGDIITLELDTIPEPHDRLEVIIRRVSGAEGTLALEDFAISGLMPADAPDERPAAPVHAADMPAFTSGRWSDGDSWTFPDAGTALTDGKGVLQTSVNIGAMPSPPERLDLNIGGDADMTGRLRVVLRAHGGGSEEILRWEGRVEDGDQLSFDIDEIAEKYERVTVIIRRVGPVSGTLWLDTPSLISGPVSSEVIPPPVTASAWAA